MSKAPKIQIIRFLKSYRHHYKDTDTIQFEAKDDKVRVEMSADGNWVGLFTTDRQGTERAKMIPAHTLVEFIDVDPSELRSWLAGAEPEPVKRGPGRPPKPREPEAA